MKKWFPILKNKKSLHCRWQTQTSGITLSHQRYVWQWQHHMDEDTELKNCYSLKPPSITWFHYQTGFVAAASNNWRIFFTCATSNSFWFLKLWTMTLVLYVTMTEQHSHCKSLFILHTETRVQVAFMLQETLSSDCKTRVKDSREPFSSFT